MPIQTRSSTLTRLCGRCDATLEGIESSDVTQCRLCFAEYHLECAEVATRDPRFGCSRCFEVPGNTPRIRIRKTNVQFEEKEEDEYPAVDVDIRSTLNRPSSCLDASPRRTREADVGLAAASAEHATTGARKREDALLQVLLQNQEMMKSLLDERRSVASSRGSEVRSRVQEWVGETTSRTPAPREQVPLAATVSQSPAHSRRVDESRRAPSRPTERWDDVANVTSARDAEEFRRLLEVNNDEEELEPRRRSSHRLPDLPRFSGLAKDWPTFIASYAESTRYHRIGDVENMDRLRKALHGAAAKSVEGTMLYSKSVAVVLERLRVLYGDPAKIMASLEAELVSVPKVDANGRGLQLLAAKTESLVTALRACNMTDRLRHPSLMITLCGKLSFFLGMRWADFARKETTGVDVFSEFLQQEMANALFAEQHQVMMQEWIPADMKNNSVKKALCAAVTVEEERPVAAKQDKFAVVKMAKTSTTTTTQMCPQCAGGHLLNLCPTFLKMNDDSRMKTVEEKGSCWSCLRLHAGRCHTRVKCTVEGCRYTHHPLLHNALANKLDHPPSGVTATVNTPDRGLFKYLPVTVCCGESEIEVFAFIDEGSSVSLIDAELANSLGASGTPCPLTLKWTNSHTQSDYDSEKIELRMRGVCGEEYTVRNLRT